MVIVIGVAGVGKSTQCKLLEDTKRYQWLSVGQFLRDTVTDPEKKAVMLAGDILDDTFVLPHLRRKLTELGDTPELVIDGFPRTITQADWLIEIHEKNEVRISHIVNLTADESIARERLSDRGRSDDSESAISERFHYYRENIMPIVSHFSSVGLNVVNIDGQRAIEEVHQEIIRVLGGE